MNFEIVTPEKTVLKDEIDQITIPTQDGQITVLPGHIPLVSVLVPGEIITKKGKEEVTMAVSGGFVEVLVDKIVILADTAERAEEIDEKRAEEARKRAEELRKKKSGDAREFAALSAQIEKELARLKVVRRRKRL
ncbi:F0F1 ATP synthase subunit epsilon [Candidatus Falkowbacteria bacterium]|nr:F0F1 ATP synthase subunit epsilon [Candidatus Falkowbacteria bacterium]MBT4433272.1 F0F1 ATP synthase subunit epsilon [Candidatus Falkowbacteria bacterium]